MLTTRVTEQLIETELHAKSSAHPNVVSFIDSFHLKEVCVCDWLCCACACA
jgi:hypothetical protein